MKMKILLINENENFRKAFSKGISQQGIQVIDFFSVPMAPFEKTIVDKIFNFFYSKVVGNKDYYQKQFAKKKATYIQERIQVFNDFYDHILVFRADILSTQHIKTLKRKTKSLLAYQYDGMSICQNLVENIPFFDSIYTFDFNDQIKYNFKPLTNCWFPDNISQEDIVDDLFYIGVGVPDRLDRIEPYTKIDLPTLL